LIDGLIIHDVEENHFGAIIFLEAISNWQKILFSEKWKKINSVGYWIKKRFDLEKFSTNVSSWILKIWIFSIFLWIFSDSSDPIFSGLEN
jgi:hypothetical protein